MSRRRAARRVTSLEAIREQAQPDIVEIPGFRPGTTIHVAVRPVDLVPRLLELGIANPLVNAALAGDQDGQGAEPMVESAETLWEKLRKLEPILDEVAKQALVEPTYEEITAIRPLTTQQKMMILEHAMNTRALRSFRGQ